MEIGYRFLKQISYLRNVIVYRFTQSVFFFFISCVCVAYRINPLRRVQCNVERSSSRLVRVTEFRVVSPRRYSEWKVEQCVLVPRMIISRETEETGDGNSWKLTRSLSSQLTERKRNFFSPVEKITTRETCFPNTGDLQILIPLKYL